MRTQLSLELGSFRQLTERRWALPLRPTGYGIYLTFSPVQKDGWTGCWLWSWKSGVEISQKFQWAFGPLVLKKWRVLDLVSLISFVDQVLNCANIFYWLFRPLVVVGPHQILRGLARGPALFWLLLEVLHLKFTICLVFTHIFFTMCIKFKWSRFIELCLWGFICITIIIIVCKSCLAKEMKW